MPWAIPPWLALVEFLQVTTKEAQRRRAMTSNNVDDDSNSDGSNINGKDGEYGINDDGEVYSDGGDNDDNDDDVDVDFVHDNDDNGTMSM
jgi:hypothetical protein